MPGIQELYAFSKIRGMCLLASFCLICSEESRDYTEVHKGYQNSFTFQCFASFREWIRQ